jgi:3-phenylpropionate/trans-cinnamate dioxygenase ferredoxin component
VGEWVSVGNESALAEGAMMEVTAAGQPVLVARVAGKFYAAQGRCPHLGGKLAAGVLSGTVIQCPLHHSQFDLTTGECLVWAPRLPAPGRAVTDLWSKKRPLKLFPTKVEDGQLWVTVDPV